MSRNQAVQKFNETLHISHNQVFTYLNCSLKYRLQYMEVLSELVQNGFDTNAEVQYALTKTCLS